MKMDHRTTRELIEAIANTVIENTGELTDLDRAIGDADHGLNLERGFKAVLRKMDQIAELPLGEALGEVGTTLILAVGGASGPLYGKLFATIGKQLAAEEHLTKDAVVAACEESVRVLKALGKAEVGQKTMLDVLVPSLDELRAGEGKEVLRHVRERARSAAQATVPMIARKGRASFLGERSQGHMDPGARSSQLIVGAVCNYLEARL
jgi:dihydroxyacetone kinase-like protein